MCGALEVAVVFTTVQNTLHSLHVADQLVADLSGRINLLLPVNGERSASAVNPVILGQFTSRYFLAMLPHSVDLQIRTTQYPASTRDLWEVLPPASIIVIAGRVKRFWPSAEQRFARRLREVGHEVLWLSAYSQSPL